MTDTLIQQLRSLGDEGFPVCWRAADALEQQAAEIEQLKLAEEGAKTAFGHVVQDKKDIAAECKRTLEQLHSAHDIIRKQAAEIAALRADAARYKWLRDVAWNNGMLNTMAERYGPEDWDEQIDAALRQEQPAGEEEK